MTCRSFPVLLLVAVAGVLVLGAHPACAEQQAGPPGAPAVHQLTLAAAIEAALSHNLQLAIEAEDIVAGEAKATADSKLRLPLLNMKANVMLWDRPIVADLGPELGKITIRDRVTGTVDVSVSQPLSGALVIGKLVARLASVAA